MIPSLILTFTATLLLVMGIYGLIVEDKYQLQARLSRYAKQKSAGKGENTDEKKDLGRSVLRWGGRFFTAFKLSKGLEERLGQADLPLREEFLFRIDTGSRYSFPAEIPDRKPTVGCS